MTGPRAGRPHWWVAGFVLLVGVAAVVYWLLSAPKTAVLPEPRIDPERAVDAREDAAAELLDDLTPALTDGTRAELAALAAPGDRQARAELADIAANVRALGVTDLAFRYVDENAGQAPAGVSAPLAESAWVGDVQLSWRLDRFEETPSDLEISMTFVETDDGAAFVSARGDYGKQTPLWMLLPLEVVQQPRSLVMVAGDRAEARRYARLAAQAVRDVLKVFPKWRGKLIVEVPEEQRDLDRILSTEATFDAIAAVTAPVDGSLAPSSPTHIFVNPPVFEPLGERGAQIVMSHEAAHVATRAATSAMPTWLLEGFADYVALAHVDLPVDVTASQILEQVRQDGPPRRLPTKQDFESESAVLGASYEAAWLATRLIAETYGEDALIAFYRRADREGGTETAFREVLGTTGRAFAAEWRGHLLDLVR